MLEMINLVFHNSAFMVSSSMWESDSDHGCLEKVIDLCMKMSNPPPWPCGCPYALLCKSGGIFFGVR